MQSPYTRLDIHSEDDKSREGKRGELPATVQRPQQSQELINQLPDELKLYVQYPEEKELPVVKYTTAETVVRPFLIGLSALMLGYPLFKTQLVRKGQIGLMWYGDEPYILGPGRHVLLSPTSQFDRLVDINEPIIEHGSLKIIRVREGQLGYGFDNETGRLVLLTPGRHIITSPTFKFQTFLDLNRPENDLGSFKLIRVETGKVGIVYRKGELKVVNPGLHLIKPPDRFRELVSTQQQVLELPETLHESSDYVQLAVKADVFYEIKNPESVYSKIDNVVKFISDTAVATLGGIIRNSTLADIGQSSRPAFGKVAETKRESKAGEQPLTDLQQLPLTAPTIPEPSAPAPSFYAKVHDQFLDELHKHAIESWGIHISNIRIESLKINDVALAKDISSQAVIYAKTQAQLANVDYQSRIQQTNANIAANTTRTQAAAEANRITQIATAEAEAIQTRAAAEGAAERKRLEEKAEGMATYVEKMSKTDLGKRLAVGDLQARALQGTQKIYIPTEGLRALSLLGLFSTPSDTVFASSSESSESKLEQHQPQSSSVAALPAVPRSEH